MQEKDLPGKNSVLYHILQITSVLTQRKLIRNIAGQNNRMLNEGLLHRAKTVALVRRVCQNHTIVLKSESDPFPVKKDKVMLQTGQVLKGVRGWR